MVQCGCAVTLPIIVERQQRRKVATDARTPAIPYSNVIPTTQRPVAGNDTCSVSTYPTRRGSSA
jgi:hypothetical protein